MAERIVYQQNKDFQASFQASDPRAPEDLDVSPVQGLHEVTPYSMMLFSLASCTAQVVLSFAQHHQLALEEVQLDLIYRREFKEDCENCQAIDRYDEHIEETIAFSGDLTEDERRKLFHIAHQCPIEKMFKSGIEVESELKSN